MAVKAPVKMTKTEVMKQLKEMADPQTKKTWIRHGAKEPFFGVKIGEMKKIEKAVKKDHALAQELYATGNSDAMYLAGLIADEKAVTKAELQEWVEKAPWHMVAEYTVPWLAAESAHGLELALKWIESDSQMIASAGWNTLGSLCTIKPDAELDKKLLAKLLKRVEKEIKNAPNRVKYTMNSFVMACGQCVEGMIDPAIAAAEKMGKVEVDMGDTSCKVHDAAAYLRDMVERGMLGRKKKKARC
jgi:3-methyladenine DNA glycosylase AlkD